MESRNGVKATTRIRVLSLGSAGVGKSCLIKRYCEKRFINKYIPTIGIDYGSTNVDVDGRKISVHFFDTSGNPLFEDVRSEFYTDMQAILLAYDVTDRLSFLALDGWLDELKSNLAIGITGSFHLIKRECEWKVVIIVCGTRIDTGGTTGRQVTEQDGKSWAEKNQFPHILTSAALGTGVNQAFQSLFVQALQMKDGVRLPGFPPMMADSEVVKAIEKLTNCKDDFEKMGLNRRGITKDELNKAYRRLAGLVHPDKCKLSTAEEAFKALTNARNNLLKLLQETTV